MDRALRAALASASQGLVNTGLYGYQLPGFVMMVPLLVTT
jgi:hypothetical protein